MNDFWTGLLLGFVSGVVGNVLVTQLRGAPGAISGLCRSEKAGGDMGSLQHPRSNGGLHTDAGKHSVSIIRCVNNMM